MNPCDHPDWLELMKLHRQLRNAEIVEQFWRRYSYYPVPDEIIERHRNVMQKIELQRAKMGLTH